MASWYIEAFVESVACRVSFMQSINLFVSFFTSGYYNFFPFVVNRNALFLSVINGKKFLVQSIQYQFLLSFFSILYVCMWMLLHFMCNHILQISANAPLWFLATAMWQILHGNRGISSYLQDFTEEYKKVNILLEMLEIIRL